MHSCIEPFGFEGEHFIDPPLQKYYDAFIYEASIRGHDLSNKAVLMLIAENTEGFRGYCRTTSKYASIKINKFFFDHSPEWMIEATVFHELGHGVLRRGHMSMDPYEPVSLMKVPARRYDYVERREEYLNELFSVL